MLLLRPSKRVHRWTQCSSLRSYSTTTQTPSIGSYSHLKQPAFHTHINGQEGGWRDAPAGYALIGDMVDNISKFTKESMKSTKSEIISLLSNHKGGLLAASHWPSIRPLAQLRIFWQPTNNVDHVLPKECEPSNEDMSPYERILQPEYDSGFFSDYSRLTVGNFGEFGNTHEDNIAKALSKLLQHGKQFETEYLEDKLELYTDDFFVALKNYVGMENSKFSILRGQTVIGNIFGYQYTAKPEFALQDHRGVFHAFIEKRGDTSSMQNKRLKDSRPDVYPQSISQKLAEALAIATHRYNIGKTAGESQEVFGIGIRHYYFTFWHAHFSREYLHSLSNASQQWQGNEHVILKSYPYSQFGLNFCDPAQRKDIMRYILRILNYLKV